MPGLVSSESEHFGPFLGRAKALEIQAKYHTTVLRVSTFPLILNLFSLGAHFITYYKSAFKTHKLSSREQADLSEDLTS
jgi:hypothetical protein